MSLDIYYKYLFLNNNYNNQQELNAHCLLGTVHFIQ